MSEESLQPKPAQAEVRRCVRCVMPEGYPGLTMDADGVCNFCSFYDRQWGEWINSAEARSRSEAELSRILEDAKRKRRPYDAVLGISGGKDSSYCLYLCTKVYGLNLLTITRDNGFMAPEGKERIDRLVEAFQVPHLYYADPLARELAGVFLRKTGHFCAPCELLSFNIHAVVAREFDIPLAIVGSSSRTDGTPPKDMNPWDPWYFGNVLKGERYKERLRCSFFSHNFVVGEGIAKVLGRRRIITLPDYVEWDEQKIAELFQRDYGIEFGKEHSDCIATDVAAYMYSKRCGGASPKIVKYSLLVRGGKMTRDKALDDLSKEQNDAPPAVLEQFLEMVGMTREEFEEASRKTPDPYLKGLPRIFNEFRRRIRRQAA